MATPAERHRDQAEQMIADLTARLAQHGDATYVDRLYRNALDMVIQDLRHALAGACPEQPEAMHGRPIGMYHCPSCGCMVVAGMRRHPHDDDCWLGLNDEDIWAGEGPRVPAEPMQWPPD